MIATTVRPACDRHFAADQGCIDFTAVMRTHGNALCVRRKEAGMLRGVAERDIC